MPLSYGWRWLRPEFIVLLVIYWSMFAPQFFGLLSAWVVGSLMDLLYLSPLGFHALGLLLISYFSYMIYRRIQNYVLWHQSVWIFILVGVFQLFSNWLGGFFDRSADTPLFLIAALLSGLIWPMVVVLLERLQVSFRLID